MEKFMFRALALMVLARAGSSNMFEASAFNGDVSAWDVSKVELSYGTFSAAAAKRRVAASGSRSMAASRVPDDDHGDDHYYYDDCYEYDN